MKITIHKIRRYFSLKLLDKKYYAKRYPDVAAANMDAFDHFSVYGMQEGRFPNRIFELWTNAKLRAIRFCVMRIWFSSKFYYSEYPDIRGSGFSAKEHYLKYGRAEGRAPNGFDRFVARRGLRLRKAIVYLRDSSSVEHLSREKELLFNAAAAGLLLRLIILFRLFRYRARTGEVKIIQGLFRPISFKKFLASSSARITVVEGDTKLAFREPVVVGEDDSRPLREVVVPKKWIATLRDVKVIGGFQVIKGNDFLIYEPSADPRNGFVAGIWRYVAGVVGHPRQIALHYPYVQAMELDEGVLLSGRCSPNYYHWMIEYLGRAQLIADREELHRIPLIVDDEMYPQEFESLQTVLPDWPLFRMPKGAVLSVKTLHIPSIATYLPDNLKEPQWKGGALSFTSLAFLRERVFRAFGIPENLAPSGRKVFLARRTGRNITNSGEIEAAVSSRGYEVVDPGVLSFEDQVRLFSSAGIIVGAMGATFTNLIFCRPGTKIVTLSSPYTQAFCVQSNMALFAKADYRIVVGSHPEFSRGDQHTVRDVNLFLDSFEMDTAAVVAALETVEHELQAEASKIST